MDNKIFKILDFCLKKNSIDEECFNFDNYFLLNRWISMAHPEIAKIVNLTTNRWMKSTKKIDIFKYYFSILPKYTKNINYLKKQIKNKDQQQEDIKQLAERHELSIREIEEYNELVDFLK